MSAEAAAAGVDWDGRKSATCRLDLMKDDGMVGGNGSGFHYGNGWIVTNSHVVGKDAEFVGRLRITFNSAGMNVVILPRPRTCYFIDIQYNVGADFERADVAMFQLTDEEMKVDLAKHGCDRLPAMNDGPLEAVPFEARASHPVAVKDTLRCFHFANGASQCAKTPCLVSDGCQTRIER